MSIPPLVCCTPPPPDQCEDDNEDFDLPYTLSQEDVDENDYDYENFPSYKYIEPVSSITNNNCGSIDKANEHIIGDNINNEKFIPVNHNQSSEQVICLHYKEDEKIMKSSEDINLEDLNLVVNSLTSTVENEVASSSIDIAPLRIDGNKENCVHPNLNQEDHILSEVALEPEADVDETVIEENISNNIKVEEHDFNENGNISKETLHQSEKTEQDENISSDEFADFEQFKFSNTSVKCTAILDDSNSPWKNNDIDNEFCEFEANFNEICNAQTSVDIVSNEESKHHKHEQIKKVSVDEEDDFDNFKSSSDCEKPNDKPEDSSITEVPVLDLQSTDNDYQITETINNVISTLFQYEITDPVDEFEGNLESLLGQTWGHLLETDERQPYIVNWNSSFSQKTLLKALCIDARNILFGPKWGHNTPKYVANLSTAPLQPQKPPSSLSSDNISTENNSRKSTWNDPFSSAGQESCSTSDKDVSQSGSTGLDVFDVTISANTSKIYSSTLTIQPLRQINLPDTHIFTPTDSETPRSKTIHYDSITQVPLSQPHQGDGKSDSEISNLSSMNTKPINNDDDYWDFQEFKSSNESVSTTTSDAASLHQSSPNKDSSKNPNIYQTQILQPIKLELTIPTLNWPDPGQVKETFEDFSDFVSKTSQDSNDPNEKLANESYKEDMNHTETSIEDKDETKHKIVADSEYEFNTFQSAIPRKTSPVVLNNDVVVTKTEAILPAVHNFSNGITDKIDFENAFLEINELSSAKSLPGLSYDHRMSEIACSSEKYTLPVGNSVLQPMPANLNVNFIKQKTSGQILQPLSLESYSQINWPNPGIDLQDLSRFNPVETLQSLKTELSVNNKSKTSSPIHNNKSAINNEPSDDDVWGEFVSIKPTVQQQQTNKTSFVDDDEWTDFVSSPSMPPQNGLNTISFNVHTNLNIQKSNSIQIAKKGNQMPIEIPSLNYITPKSSGHASYNDKHFQNL